MKIERTAMHRASHSASWTTWCCLCVGSVFANCWNEAVAQELNNQSLLSIVPHKKMFDDPLQFNGYPGVHRVVASVTEIYIGFFAPSTEDRPMGQEMWQGASLAIELANEGGGCEGKPFRLLSRWSDDPWRGGSEKLIQLVYRDRVWALIGGMDGETTHLAEQIANKARLPLLTPTATDVTLTQIRIPWMFRLAPSDRQQAERMADLISKDAVAQRIAVLHSTKHDARVGVDELMKALTRIQRLPVARFEIPTNAIISADMAGRLHAMDVDCLILWCSPEEAKVILTTLQQVEYSWPIYAPIALDTPEFYPVAQTWSKQVTLLTAWDESIQTGPRLSFTERYKNRYRTEPNFPAAASFDAVNLIVNAIQNAGLNRAKVRDSIADTKDYVGAIGPIRWDGGGGNPAPVGVRYFNRSPS